MSKAKWFVVRKSSTGATSANQIVPSEFRQRYKNVVLYSPFPSWRVEGGSGFETSGTFTGYYE